MEVLEEVGGWVAVGDGNGQQGVKHQVMDHNL